mgnify:CR=1 FL=1
MSKENILFQKGVQAFNKKHFYDAHEYWEELWLEYKLDDAKFIQGLIQLAVSYFHLFNQNLNGARSMMRKSLGKFESFENARDLDVDNLKKELLRVQSHFNDIEKTSDFKDSYIVTLKVIYE